MVMAADSAAVRGGPDRKKINCVTSMAYRNH
jgi:hypothetical protein